LTRKIPTACLAFLALGCAHQESFGYRPVTRVTATPNGFPASRYAVPPQAPRGEVTVGTFGLTELEVAPGVRDIFVHARLVVANDNDDQPWTVDPWRQVLVLPGHGEFGPAYMNSTVPAAPVVTVRPGARLVMDLFYTLPTGLKREWRLPSYQVSWNVDTGAKGVIAERTPFERFEVPLQGQPPRYAVAVGWGPVWWVNPWWPVHRHWWWQHHWVYQPWPHRVVVLHRPRVVRIRRPYFVAQPAPAVPAPPARARPAPAEPARP
jgi:hypothetical protein